MLSRRLNLSKPINWKHPQNRGLVSRFLTLPQVGRGFVSRDLCNRNFGTLTGGPAWSGAMGRPGGHGCISYPGASDYVAVPSTIFNYLSGGIVSVTQWIRPSSVGAYETLFDAGTPSVRQLSAFLGGAANKLYVGIAGSIGNEAVLSESWTINEWQHLGIKSDGTTVTVYRNGINIGTIASAVGAGFTASEWQIHGNPTTGGANYNGQSDDVSIFNRALPDSDFLALYHLSRQKFSPLLNWIRSPVMASQAAAGIVYTQLERRTRGVLRGVVKGER